MGVGRISGRMWGTVVLPEQVIKSAKSVGGIQVLAEGQKMYINPRFTPVERENLTSVHPTLRVPGLSIHTRVVARLLE